MSVNVIEYRPAYRIDADAAKLRFARVMLVAGALVAIVVALAILGTAAVFLARLAHAQGVWAAFLAPTAPVSVICTLAVVARLVPKSGRQRSARRARWVAVKELAGPVTLGASIVSAIALGLMSIPLGFPTVSPGFVVAVTMAAAPLALMNFRATSRGAKEES